MTEYCDALNINMRVDYVANNGCGEWRARIDGAEIKDKPSSPVALSEFGIGNTPQNAISNYVSLIRGKYLVLNGLTQNRREFFIPDYIE